ncbi:hypothetical protein, partial [Arthrobacter sp. UYEF21]|uniref:hypothetical protein n=1 Tax=Arthrobacter sp. UYEF21 TaxID=1756364 RepID=UPI0033993ADA
HGGVRGLLLIGQTELPVQGRPANYWQETFPTDAAGADIVMLFLRFVGCCERFIEELSITGVWTALTITSETRSGLPEKIAANHASSDFQRASRAPL